MTSERKNLIEPKEWWKAFQDAATKEGLSLSEWVGKHCLEALPASVRKKLPKERDTVGRPKKEE